MNYKRLSTRNRVKDAYQYSYGTTDWGGKYNEDFEMADEDYETAVYIMNEVMKIEEKNNVGNKNVEGWVNALYEILDLLEKTQINDYDELYRELEDANFHEVYAIMWLSGMAGEERQQEEIAFLNEYADRSYRTSQKAEKIIAKDMGLM